MKFPCVLVLALFAFPGVIGFGLSAGFNQSLRDQNELLFRQLKQSRELSDYQINAVR